MKNTWQSLINKNYQNIIKENVLEIINSIIEQTEDENNINENYRLDKITNIETDKLIIRTSFTDNIISNVTKVNKNTYDKVVYAYTSNYYIELKNENIVYAFILIHCNKDYKYDFKIIVFLEKRIVSISSIISWYFPGLDQYININNLNISIAETMLKYRPSYIYEDNYKIIAALEIENILKTSIEDNREPGNYFINKELKLTISRYNDLPTISFFIGDVKNNRLISFTKTFKEDLDLKTMIYIVLSEGLKNLILPRNPKLDIGAQLLKLKAIENNIRG